MLYIFVENEEITHIDEDSEFKKDLRGNGICPKEYIKIKNTNRKIHFIEVFCIET